MKYGYLTIDLRINDSQAMALHTFIITKREFTNMENHAIIFSGRNGSFLFDVLHKCYCLLWNPEKTVLVMQIARNVEIKVCLLLDNACPYTGYMILLASYTSYCRFSIGKSCLSSPKLRPRTKQLLLVYKAEPSGWNNFWWQWWGARHGDAFLSHRRLLWWQNQETHIQLTKFIEVHGDYTEK